MPKFLCTLFLAIWLSGCVSCPTSTLTSPVTVEDLLIRDVQEVVATYPRPQAFQGEYYYSQLSQEAKQWDDYHQGLAASLNKLFSDTRSHSLSTQSLASVFEKGSGLPLAVYESPTGFILASILDAYPEVRTGGGNSPDTRSDAVYILNRRGDIWSLGRVVNVVDAVWVEEHWVVLVAWTRWGSAMDYEVWHVHQGNWTPETIFTFNQLHSVPEPQLGLNGQTVMRYTLARDGCDSVSPTPCELTNNTENLCTFDIVAEAYVWQDGQYRCRERQVIETATP